MWDYIIIGAPTANAVKPKTGARVLLLFLALHPPTSATHHV